MHVERECRDGVGRRLEEIGERGHLGAELRAMFDTESQKYDVYPLSDETVSRALPHNRPSYVAGTSKVTLYDDCIRLPEMSSVNLKNTS